MRAAHGAKETKVLRVMPHRGRVYAHCPASAGMKPPLQVSAGDQAAGAFTAERWRLRSFRPKSSRRRGWRLLRGNWFRATPSVGETRPRKPSIRNSGSSRMTRLDGKTAFGRSFSLQGKEHIETVEWLRVSENSKIERGKKFPNRIPKLPCARRNERFRR